MDLYAVLPIIFQQQITDSSFLVQLLQVSRSCKALLAHAVCADQIIYTSMDDYNTIAAAYPEACRNSKRIQFSHNIIVNPGPLLTNIVSSRLLQTLCIPEDRSIQNRHIQHCVALRRLILPKNKCISNAGLVNMSALRYLDLSANTRVTDAGLQNKHRLEYLRMLFNKHITDAAFIYMRNLRCVDLGYNKNKKLCLSFVAQNQYLLEVRLQNANILHKVARKFAGVVNPS